MSKITGMDAVKMKQDNPSIVLCKHADPLEGYREDISVDDALEIIKEDPSLVYVKQLGCDEINTICAKVANDIIDAMDREDTYTMHGHTIRWDERQSQWHACKDGFATSFSEMLYMAIAKLVPVVPVDLDTVTERELQIALMDKFNGLRPS